jgi:hypothetical protein
VSREEKIENGHLSLFGFESETNVHVNGAIESIDTAMIELSYVLADLSSLPWQCDGEIYRRVSLFYQSANHALNVALDVIKKAGERNIND